jgi:predicted enzyme related to lactoylglutathione lyase
MNRSLFSLLVALALGVNTLPTRAAEPELPPLPALNDPATDTRLPGKFVWADLFTSDVAGAQRFYSEVFGWEWRWISEHPEHVYGMFYENDIAVAGVARHQAPDPERAYGRWVHYIATADVEAAAQATTERGGRVMLARQSFANRGDFAVLADPENAPFGVLNSTSGDPPDFRAELGEWLWIGLFSRDPERAGKFYESVFGYAVRGYDERPDVLEFMLEAGGFARGGIGKLGPNSESNPTWVGFVRIEDLDATLAKARAAGGEVLWEPDPEAEKRDLAVVADPFGAPVGVMEWTFEEEVEEAEAAAEPSQ